MNILLVTMLFLCICIGIGYVFRKPIGVWFEKHKKKLASIGITSMFVGTSVFLLAPVGDIPIVDIKDVLLEPYIYTEFVKPPNSFGMENTTFKDVNETFYRNWLNDTIVWVCEKSTDNIHWVNCDKCLEVKKEWNADKFTEKHTLIITADEDAYYRTYYKTPYEKNILTIDDKSLVDENSPQVDMSFKITDTENYDIFYNWSDFKNSPENSKAGINKKITSDTGNKESFEYEIYSYDKLNKGEVLEIDPNFGNDVDSSSGSYSIENVMYGIYAAPSSNGVLDSISVKLYSADANHDAKCAIYDYTDHNSVWAGAKIAVTETLDIAATTAYYTFNFSEPKPSVVQGTNYYICVVGTSLTGSLTALSTSDASRAIYKVESFSTVFDNDPMVGETGASADILMYGSYTEGSEPVSSNPNPSMAAYNETVGTVVCNVTVADDDGETMNVTFLTSTDNITFVHQQTNTSVGNGSYSFDYTTTNYDTTYYWNVTVDDGVGNNNVSTIYNFETTPYRTLRFNDTFNSENWINDSNNMSFETGWENFTYVGGTLPYSANGDFNDGSVENLIVTEDGFVHDDSDDEGWYYGDNTPSSNTGADSPYEGARLLYIESSIGHYNYDNFLDFPITLTPSTNVTVEFMYYMYGSATATLSVELIDSENSEVGDLWTLSGQQQSAGNQAWRKGICGIDDLGSYDGNYEIRFHGLAGSAYAGDICIDWIFINQTNASVLDAWILSEPIFKSDGYTWDTFDAFVNSTTYSGFALVDPDDHDHNITSGLVGDGDDISSVTNGSVCLYGNFSDDSVNMASWNISWTTGGGAPAAPDTPPTIESNFTDGQTTGIGLNCSNFWFNDSEGDIIHNWMNASNGQIWSVNSSNVTGYIVFSGLDYSTQYWVNCSSYDGENLTEYDISFNTSAYVPVPPDTPTDFEYESPANGSTGQELAFTWQVNCNDSEGDTVDSMIQCLGFTDTYSSQNETLTLSLSGLSYNTEYTVYCWANDTNNFTEEQFTFTTIAAPAAPDTPVAFSNPDPANETGNQEIAFTWTCTVNDAEGDFADWHVQIAGFTDNGATNDTVSIAVSALSYSTEYSVICWANDTNNVTHEVYKFTTKDVVPVPSYNLTIRNDDVDYFVWLGENTTAYNVSQQIDNFDEANEYISIWNCTNFTEGNSTQISWTDTSDGDISVYGDTRQAQRFTISDIAIELWQINVSIKDNAASPGNLQIKIKEIINDMPSDAVIAEGLILAANIPDNYAMVSCNLNSSVILYNNTDYCIYFSSPETAVGDSIYWKRVDGFSDGTRNYTTDGDSTWVDGGSITGEFEIIGVSGDTVWDKYYGDGSGNNWTIDTFEVIHILLSDSGTQGVKMFENESWNYTNSKTFQLINKTNNKGYNFSGYNKESGTTTSAINTSIGLEKGEGILLWNRTSYSWIYYSAHLGITSDNVEQWDVILSKVEDTETWVT